MFGARGRWAKLIRRARPKVLPCYLLVARFPRRRRKRRRKRTGRRGRSCSCGNWRCVALGRRLIWQQYAKRRARHDAPGRRPLCRGERELGRESGPRLFMAAGLLSRAGARGQRAAANKTIGGHHERAASCKPARRAPSPVARLAAQLCPLASLLGAPRLAHYHSHPAPPPAPANTRRALFIANALD